MITGTQGKVPYKWWLELLPSSKPTSSGTKDVNQILEEQVGGVIYSRISITLTRLFSSIPYKGGFNNLQGWSLTRGQMVTVWKLCCIRRSGGTEGRWGQENQE